jgi:hypothetical protein
MQKRNLKGLISLLLAIVGVLLNAELVSAQHQKLAVDVINIDRERVLSSAERFLKEEPVTVTTYKSPRSAGGLHDYFSEGDYWWPDPNNPDGPYTQRDGMTNPDNFVLHRQAMLGFSRAVSTLVAAYRITGDEKYAAHALKHVRAWFIDEETKMNPHLKYGQAIRGKATGRGTGIIDTIHLIEIARALESLRGSKSMSETDEKAINQWFAEYLEWMTTHQYGLEEREAKNNHGTWWVAQVSAFAHLVNDTARLNYCKTRFKTVLLPHQMGVDGSFPLELKRTKPYNYSLFNLEGMALICWILSTHEESLWDFTLPDGRNMCRATEFMYPYIADKSKWPYPKDVMYFEFYPARVSSLLFAGIALNEQKYVGLWKTLDADPTIGEVQRNMPIRQPILWVQ